MYAALTPNGTRRLRYGATELRAVMKAYELHAIAAAHAERGAWRANLDTESPIGYRILCRQTDMWARRVYLVSLAATAAEQAGYR